jgi:phosphoglycerate kinase
VIRNLLPKVDALLIGGGMAYTFLAANGVEVGKSLVEKDKLQLATELLGEAARQRVKFLLPVDHVTGDTAKANPATSADSIPPERMGLDIGPRTVQLFSDELRRAKMVLWNGPVGLFEVPPYDNGTRALAQTLADARSTCVSVIAGGDTVAAVSAARVGEYLAHLSTGGGATLEFLEGRKLPGVEALECDA